MPSRNSLKEFDADEYYHVYNRGVEKRDIFLDDQDFTVFLGLLKKYIAGEEGTRHHHHKFEVLGEQVQLLAYCLSPNHFHLLLYQTTPDGITKLMRRVITGYVMYFNSRYGRVGGLFQGRYKASRINSEAYLHHISRYIHLNPDDYKSWPYSSYANYQGDQTARWLTTEPVLAMFNGSSQEYLEFLADYVDTKKELDILKYQLANELEEF